MPRKAEAEIARMRQEFFAKPQPCLRTSPLAKKYGWGFVFDEQGRVALCPMESAEYRGLLAGGQVKVLKAMRSSRADRPHCKTSGPPHRLNRPWPAWRPGVGHAAIRTVSRPADVLGYVLKLEPKDESGDPPSKTRHLLPSGNRSH